MTTIRLMNDDDLDFVTDLWDQHVTEVGGGAFDENTRMRIFGSLCRCLPAAASICYVAKQEDKLVGFIVGAVSTSEIWEGSAGEIEELYVIPDARRQKVATSLVNAVTGWLMTKGAGMMRVQSAHNSSEAHAFWAALGWEGDLTTYSRYQL